MSQKLDFVTPNLSIFIQQKITEKVLDLAANVDFEFIGHRVVHGGELFRDVTEMTEENLSKLSTISSILDGFSSVIVASFYLRSGTSTQPSPDPCYQPH